MRFSFMGLPRKLVNFSWLFLASFFFRAKSVSTLGGGTQHEVVGSQFHGLRDKGLLDVTWISINFQKILGFSLFGFSFIFKKYSVLVYSVKPLFSKNIRLQFIRFCLYFQKILGWILFGWEIFLKNIRFVLFGFAIFLKKCSVFGYSVLPFF